jgi:hypothetical protein
MPAHKTTDLTTEGDAISEEGPETATESTGMKIGVPAQAGYNAEGDLDDLRAQMRALGTQIAALADNAKTRSIRLARQGEATVKLYPVSSLLTVATVAAVVGLAVAGARSARPRSRYDRSRDDVADVVEALRARLNI